MIAFSKTLRKNLFWFHSLFQTSHYGRGKEAFSSAETMLGEPTVDRLGRASMKIMGVSMDSVDGVI